MVVCTLTRPCSPLQVNLLLLTSGHEPHLQRLLQQAALGLCCQSVAGSTDGKQLLPHLFAKFVEPSLQLQIPLALGGRLAQASSGVLLLHSSQLSGKQGAALAACLRASSTPLAPNMPELAVRLTPTTWCVAEDQGGWAERFYSLFAALVASEKLTRWSLKLLPGPVWKHTS